MGELPIKKNTQDSKLNTKAILGLVIILLIGSFITVKLVQLNSVGRSATINKPTTASHEAFIEAVSPTAVAIQNQEHVPASISIAQAALESDWGQSKLAADYNNLYGVKGSRFTRNVDLPTKEFEDGKWKTIDQPFRWYDNWNDSMWGHASLLVNGTDDNAKRYSEVIDSDNYKDAAHALVDGGYATDPDYAEKVIDLIETYRLDKYDEQ